MLAAFANGWKRVFGSVFMKHGQVIWDRASGGASNVSSPNGGERNGGNTPGRNELVCKQPLLVNQRGLPLVMWILSVQAHDLRLRSKR